MQQAHVRIGARRPGNDISPLLYGHFIEFIRDGISGMWSEMVTSRSFEQPGKRPHLAAAWEFAAGDLTRATAGNPSPTALRLNPTPASPAMLVQSPLSVRAGMTYLGSAWIWGSAGDVRLSIALTNGEGQPLAQADLPIPEQGPTPVDFSLEVPVSCDEARLVLTAVGSGAAYVDQVSLMPADNEAGWRHDVLDLIRGLKPPFIRFPGGCFADIYHWRDGVGERDLRPTRFNHAWKHVWDQLEGNEVGTAEFIDLCRLVGCEPVITVNFGSASPEEAAAWVEYCNGDSTTPMGRLRAAHGHPEPFGVKLWELGNEPWGHWEVGCCDAATNARRYLEFRKAMLAVDPGLVLLATGSNANETDRAWDQTVADMVGADMDYLTLHYYAPQLRPEEYGLPESTIYEGTAAAALKLEESLSAAAAALGARGLSGKVALAVTEWNTMYMDESNRETTLGAAVCNATFLNLFLRHSPQVAVGAFSDLVDGWEGGLIRSGREGAYGTPSYWAFSLYAGHEGRHGLAADVESPTYDAPALGHLPARKGVPVLDVAATESADGMERWCFLVNRSLTEEIAVSLEPGVDAVTAVLDILAADSITAVNSYAAPRQVAPATRRLHAEAGLFQIALPPHSVARLRVKKGDPVHD